jgi:hypothetical protein
LAAAQVYDAAMSPLRFWLGMIQMGVATVSVILLIRTGIGPLTVVSAAIATGVTLWSRALPRRPH